MSEEEKRQTPETGPYRSAAEGSDIIFDTLWSRVLEAWEDDKPHHAILDYALKSQKLPDLAGKYRSLKDDPEKGVRAQKKIDGIVVAATQMMMAMKTPARTKTPTSWTLSVGIVSAIIFGWLYWLLFKRH